MSYSIESSKSVKPITIISLPLPLSKPHSPSLEIQKTFATLAERQTDEEIYLNNLKIRKAQINSVRKTHLQDSLKVTNTFEKRKKRAKILSCLFCPCIYIGANLAAPCMIGYCCVKACCRKDETTYDNDPGPKNKVQLCWKSFDPCVCCCPKEIAAEEFSLPSERRQLDVLSTQIMEDEDALRLIDKEIGQINRKIQRANS